MRLLGIGSTVSRLNAFMWQRHRVCMLTMIVCASRILAQQDDLGVASPVLNPTGNVPGLFLDFRPAPVIGQLSNLRITTTSPVNGIALVGISPRLVASGTPLQLRSGTGLFYLDPSVLSIVALPMFGSLVQLPIPFPNQPAMVGSDFAMQSLVTGVSGGSQVEGFSNAVVVNVGMTGGKGAVLGPAYRIRGTVTASGPLVDTQGSAVCIFKQSTTNTTICIVFRSLPTAHGGMYLSLQSNGTGPVIHSFPATTTINNVIRITIPPATGAPFCLYLINASGTAMQVEFDVPTHC